MHTSSSSTISRFTLSEARDYFLIALGTVLQALALRLFLVPANLVSGGVSGIAQVINHYTGLPIGIMIFLGNVPLFLLGWRHLGGRRFAVRTGFAVIMVSALTDLLYYVLPKNGLTGDILLNTLYGGLVSGAGYGLVYLGRGTSGGSDILARILQRWRGIPLSQSYLVTDSLVILVAGLSFSWEKALYALLVLYISGVAAEGVVSGPNVVRTAMIITDQPAEVTQEILVELERGVTLLEGTGGYTGKERQVLYCVIGRSEVNQLKAIVHDIDPRAFMVIGQAYEAIGEGFLPVDKSQG